MTKAEQHRAAAERRHALRKMRGEMRSFAEFFTAHGVAWTSGVDNCITVGQTHFYFDAQGRYTQLEWDDMGCIEKRLLR